jgi:signal transduction histidine kinase
MIVLGAPILRENGSFAGMLLGGVRVRDAALTELVRELTPGGHGFAYLIDRRGHIIYHPDVTAIGADFNDRPFVQAVDASETGGIVWDSPSGDRWIVDYAPVRDSGWGIIVKEQWDAAVAPAQTSSILLIGVGVGVVIAAAVWLWRGVKRIAAPIGMLAQQAERLGAGNHVEPIGGSGVHEINALSQAFDRMAAQIESYQTGLRRYANAVTQSQEDERRRIARELHDEPVQNLFGLARRLEVYHASATQPGRREQLVETREVIVETLKSVRQISRDLRPIVLEDLGLIPALETLVSAAGDDDGTALPVTLEVTGEPAVLDHEQELALYRITQEALTNVRNHAQATTASVRLAFYSNIVHLTVSDNGKGFVLPPLISEFTLHDSLDLMGIQERVWAVNAALTIDTAPSKGTRLDVKMPIDHTQLQSLPSST